jgi:hypothetical protein
VIVPFRRRQVFVAVHSISTSWQGIQKAIYDTTVREILRQDVRSVLREMPDNAAVFVISDHGFTPVPDKTFVVPNEVLTDSGDVKFEWAA